VGEYTNFFQKFGFVVIDKVLAAPEIDATIDELWAEVERFDWKDYNPALVGNKVRSTTEMIYQCTILHVNDIMILHR